MPKKSSKPSAIVVRRNPELAHVERLIAPPEDAIVRAVDVGCNQFEKAVSNYGKAMVTRLFRCGATVAKTQTQAAASVNAALSS